MIRFYNPAANYGDTCESKCTVVHIKAGPSGSSQCPKQQRGAKESTTENNSMYTPKQTCEAHLCIPIIVTLNLLRCFSARPDFPFGNQMTLCFGGDNAENDDDDQLNEDWPCVLSLSSLGWCESAASPSLLVTVESEKSNSRIFPMFCNVYPASDLYVVIEESLCEANYYHSVIGCVFQNLELSFAKCVNRG